MLNLFRVYINTSFGSMAKFNYYIETVDLFLNGDRVLSIQDTNNDILINSESESQQLANLDEFSIVELIHKISSLKYKNSK